MKRVAVVGATGYTGSEIVDILLGHAGVEITSLSAKLDEPVPVERELPSFAGRISIACEPLDLEDVCAKAEVVFLALPHGISMKCAPFLLERGKKVVDLSADFRFGGAAVYEKWYGKKHEAGVLLRQAVYGLPELHAADIRGAALVANPGCYPTGAILALAPLFAAGVPESGSIIVDAKSGVTGAGRKASLELGFAECNESMRAYRPGSHQHAPEIEGELSRLSGGSVEILFVPHLAPMNRGILTTAYLVPRSDLSGDELFGLYRDFYANAPFVRLMEKDSLPDTKNVRGLNYCDIAVRRDGRTGRIVVISAIDNLVKGAAGQAVQNMNLMCGFGETEGLRAPHMSL